jgi:hypothetical protein
VYPFLATDERIIRPANYPPGAPGRGLTVRPAADGSEVAEGPARLDAALISAAGGRATAIEAIDLFL